MIDTERLKSFAILASLTRDGLARAAEHLSQRDLPPGEVLFLKGDDDKLVYFLLEGSVSLRSDDSSAAVFIRADTDAAQMPLSRLKPRRYTATAGTFVRVAAIDEDLLDDLMTADQTATYEVSLIEGEDPEWMFRLFSSPAFKKVPTDNLAALFSRMQPVDVRAGQTIVRQGEAGDYYYLIRRGRAQVQQARQDGIPAKVAELGVGDGFGEEALLSGDPRNATVGMIEDGQLMRLSLADFNGLLRPPMVQRVDAVEAIAMVRNGAKFLDVRTEAEFREHSLNLPGSLNVPLCDLRRLSEGLRRGTQYITVCQTGRRCTAAAFLLSQRGFDVYVLRGGLDTVGQG